MAPAFRGGDKVFAKMRGHPAWPARVEGVADSTPNCTKYHVLFYGTLQRGVCRSQEIFPYEEHKEKYTKSVKRKGFKEALDQIEGVSVPELVPKIIIEKLSNGNEVTEVAKTSLNIKMNNCDRTSIGKKGVKKKYDSFISRVSDTNTCSVAVDSSGSKYDDNESVETYTSKLTEKCQEGNKAIVQIKETNDVMYLSPVCSKTASRKCYRQKALKKYQKHNVTSDLLVSSYNPKTQISDLANCQQEGQKIVEVMSNGTTVTPTVVSPECNERQAPALPFKSEKVSRSGRIIKRKSFPDETGEPIPKKKCIQRQSHDHMNHQQSGQQTEEDEDEEEIQIQRIHSEDAHISRERIEKRQTARKWLATENCMTRLDTLVRAQLGMNKANPEQCIRFLDDMCNLDLRPLMLKKHPEVVETIKRLRKYVGNASAWNFSDEQLKEFEEQAHQIRLRAEYLFDKFKFLFCAPDNSTFLTVFADSVVAFQTQTQHWPLAKIYALVTEPKTRRPSKTHKVQSKNKDS